MSKHSIGEFLAIQRKERGMTQREVADLLGISNKTLSSWESGRSYPDILLLPALADLYGVTIDEIVNGERVHGETTGEIAEKSRKTLLRRSLDRYSVKCATLAGVGIGGVGLLVLAFLLGTVAYWLFILFAVLSVLTEATVALLFVVFEKTALLAEEEKSRYSLTVKRTTYKAIFKIVCAVCTLAVCLIFPIQLQTNRNITAASILTGALLLLVLLLTLFLLWLSRRGKEFYTAEEAVASIHNKKLALRLLSVGGAISLVLFIATSILSETPFTHTEKSTDLPKEDFIRLVQTVEITADDAKDYGIVTEGDGAICNYFVDIKTALSTPAETSLFEKHGYAYHIEGNLYFDYLIDDSTNGQCSVCYIPNPSEAFESTLFRGTFWFRDREQWQSKYPNPTAEDLITGIENEEVFFVLDRPILIDASPTTHFGGYRYDTKRYVEVTDERYALVREVVQNYPYLSLISMGGVLITSAVCIGFYCKKRSAIL